MSSLAVIPTVELSIPNMYIAPSEALEMDDKILTIIPFYKFYYNTMEERTYLVYIADDYCLELDLEGGIVVDGRDDD